MIQIKQVSKTFSIGNERIEVLKDISLSIGKGEWFSILGPSGSGKSTLLNCLSGQDIPEQGEVWIEGKLTRSMSTKELQTIKRNEIGYVFQDFRLLPQYDVLDNVCLPLLPYKKKKHVLERALVLLEEVGLSHRVHHLPEELSGGEKQRAAIARALLNEPSVLICDEPTGNLDAANRDRILELLAGLHRSDHTIIVATHDLEVAAKGQKEIRMKDGKAELGAGTW